ncbi:MAG: hypothetical protein ACRDAM_19445 [Casimicrobium sp.]
MSYSLEHLSLFEPLADPNSRDGTAYFELHPRELPEPHACWLEGSFFLRDAAFDFFAECFHSADESFDYFSFQRFGERDIDRLLAALQEFLQELESQRTREVAFSRYASLFTVDIWSDVDTAALAHAVLDCGNKMRGFIASNTRDSKCLWVLGM